MVIRLTAYSGCTGDSLVDAVTIHAVSGVFPTTVNKAICRGTSYARHSAAGAYADYYNSVSGCDSLRTLYLTIISPVTSTVTQTICQAGSYACHSSSATYTDHYTSAAGCDSARTLNLTVATTIATTVNQTICQDNS